jgi:hypothetical protein
MGPFPLPHAGEGAERSEAGEGDGHEGKGRLPSEAPLRLRSVELGFEVIAI